MLSEIHVEPVGDVFRSHGCQKSLERNWRTKTTLTIQAWQPWNHFQLPLQPTLWCAGTKTTPTSGLYYISQ